MIRKPMDEKVIKKIFQKLHGRLGNKFLNQYRIGELNDDGQDIGIENAKKEWGERLAGFTRERIIRGLEYDYADKNVDCDVFRRQCSSGTSSLRDFKALEKPKLTKAEVTKRLETMYKTLGLKLKMDRKVDDDN